MGYNIQAYIPSENISIVVLAENTGRHPDYVEIRNVLYRVGAEYAVLHDSGSSTFLYDYGANRHIFTVNELEKAFSNSLGYGYTYQ